MRPAPPWSVVYADGAANVYGFDATADEVLFAYEPMTPARSSSGVYSGGEPKQLELAPEDPRLDELWRYITALEADTASHAQTRCKGDGAFTVRTPAGERRFLVVRAATRELEAMLDELL